MENVRPPYVLEDSVNNVVVLASAGGFCFKEEPVRELLYIRSPR